MRGFSLIEVIIAFIISILALSTIFLTLSFFTNVLIKFNNKNILQEISYINTLVIESDNLGTVRLKKITLDISVAGFNVNECTIKMLKDTEYTLCYVKSNNKYLQYKGWKIFYNPKVDIFIVQMD